VLLACTHYPAILSVLKHHAPDVEFLDPAEELVAVLKRQKISRSRGRDEFFTTGSAAAMKTAARRAFDMRIHTATHISL
jgi:glutamate racemase